MTLLYLATKPAHAGVDVDGLACPCIILWLAAVRQGDMASCQALSCPIATVGGGASPGDVKPPSLDIWRSIDCVGTCATEYYMA
jgi:hypothetical protein